MNYSWFKYRLSNSDLRYNEYVFIKYKFTSYLSKLNYFIIPNQHKVHSEARIKTGL